MTALVAALLAGLTAIVGGRTPSTATGVSPRPWSQAERARSHAYFDMLLAHPSHWKSYSLREDDQLRQYARCRKCPLDIVYDPAMDAAKVLVAEGRTSIRNQVYLPMETLDGHAYFVVWDALWTSSFLRRNHGFNNYKAFQFDSNRSIWLETQMRFGGGKARMPGFDPERHVGVVTVRSYNRPGGPRTWTATCANCLPPSTTGTHPLAPAEGRFIVWPDRWTRYFWLIEQRPNDYDLVSFWVADEQTDPVQVYDRVAVSVRDGNTIDYLRLEFNTSANASGRSDGAKRRRGARKGIAARTRESQALHIGDPDTGDRRKPLVAYVRNVVILRDPGDVKSFLKRPVSGDEAAKAR
jgi:hypothetical protein